MSKDLDWLRANVGGDSTKCAGVQRINPEIRTGTQYASTNAPPKGKGAATRGVPFEADA